MKQVIQHIKDVAQGKAPIGTMRSTHWPTVRKAHLEKFPTCAVCGGKERLQVHHIRPFHLHPELELDPNNLITLCEGAGDCHLVFGHLHSFKSFNEDVKKDSAEWADKIANRPKTGDEA